MGMSTVQLDRENVSEIHYRRAGVNRKCICDTFLRPLGRQMVSLTPRLCRAARALIGIEQKDLASAAGVAKSTIGAFEIKGEDARLSGRINAALLETFEAAGLVFIPENGGGAGVRLRHRSGEHQSK